MAMVLVVKWTKIQLVLLVGILNASVGFGDFLLAYYLPTTLAAPSQIFFTAIVNLVAAYFSTEEQDLSSTVAAKTSST